MSSRSRSTMDARVWVRLMKAQGWKVSSRPLQGVTPGPVPGRCPERKARLVDWLPQRGLGKGRVWVPIPCGAVPRAHVRLLVDKKLELLKGGLKL